MSFTQLRFPPVAEGSINTDQFLESCNKVASFFDLLDSSIFRPAKKDITGNIKKIRNRMAERPGELETLGKLIDAELKETDSQYKLSNGQGIATNALMWLRRVLEFVSRFFHHFLLEDYVNSSNVKENLVNCANMAYEESLSPHHNWFARNLIFLALNAFPGRQKFLQNISGAKHNENDDETTESMRAFNDSLSKNLTVIQTLFKEKGVEKEA